MQHQWNVIGHEKQVQYLQNCIQNGKINHAYLFYGPPHLGKKRVGESFVFSLLCVSKTEDRPCGRCQNCEQVHKNIHSDVYWLEPEEDKTIISVKQVRGLISKLSKKALHQGYKIAIIKQASALTEGAANALLKTLEEPSPKTVILLLAENLQNIPKTVASRCQNLRFLPVPQEKIYDYLLEQKLERDQALKIARLSHGKPGLAINFFKNKKALKQQEDKLKIFIDLMIEPGEMQNKFKLIEKLSKSKELIELFDLGLTYLRDLILKQHNLNNYMVNPLGKEIEDVGEIKNKIQKIKQAQKSLRQNVQAKLVLENLIISNDNPGVVHTIYAK